MSARPKIDERSSERAMELLAGHAAKLAHQAARFAPSAQDAEDALQRAIVILLTNAPEIEGDALVRWMYVVVRNEALATARAQQRLGLGRFAQDEAGGPLDPERLVSSEPDPAEQALRSERVERSRVALERIKPDERRALLAKAAGLSYTEIADQFDWTYTKVNRLMAEGRRAFLAAYAELEAGGSR